MEDYNSKYSGEQVEQLLDQVASGGTGGGESDIYIWEFNDPLEDGATGTIEREVFNKLAEAKSVWMRSGDVYTVCNEHVGDSSSILFLLFTTIQQDVMRNYAISIDGETLQYDVAGYEISIQDAIFDLDDIRSGAEKGATALQELPSEAVIHNEDGAVITQRGTLVDNNVGMLYALPFTDEADREDADAILAWYTTSGELVLENGILVDNKEGHLYALPYASDEDKAGADSVIASEAYVDSKIGSGSSNGANVQAVDTGDVLDDVNVDYITKAYFDSVVGNINGILESIINGCGGVSLITFTIAGTEYQAESGMTWEEWVNSEYNTNSDISIRNGVVFLGLYQYIVGISVSDVIINNGSYTTSRPGSDA